jgi:hypothetical protein
MAFPEGGSAGYARTEFLRVSPTRYVLLRRSRQIGVALRNADPEAVNIAELTGRFDFPQTGDASRPNTEQPSARPTSATLQRAQRPDSLLRKIRYFCIARAEIGGLASCCSELCPSGISQSVAYLEQLEQDSDVHETVKENRNPIVRGS